MTLPHMSMFANNALLGGGVRVRVWIREQRKIKRRSRALLSLWWQTWTSLTMTTIWVVSTLGLYAPSQVSIHASALKGSDCSHV